MLLPKKSGENEKISQTGRTILETKATPEEMAPDIMELAMEGKYSYEEASREVVADAMADILPDSHFVENLYQKNQNLFERVLNKLKEFVKNVREYFAHVNPNTKLEAAVLKENTESGMRYLEKVVESFDKTAEAAVENYQQGTTESTAESRTQYKTRGKYWRPDLKGSEWQLLERRMAEEIGSRENFLDDATKWVYANEKGVQVFALCGVGDGTEATPLYAVGGKRAKQIADDLLVKEDAYEKNDRGRGAVDSWIESIRRKKGSSDGNRFTDGNGRTAVQNDELHVGSQRSNAGGAAERSSENQRKVKEKFSLRDSTGRELTEAQQAYFKDSKVRDPDIRYSLREIGGKVMPVLDIQNDTRDYKVAEAYLKTLVDTEHPFATILMDAQPVYIGKDLPGEYKGSEYTHGLNSSTRQVKMQAATNLDEMLLLAENGEWRENVKDKHKTDAQNGWYRYEARFAVPVLTVEKTVDHYTVYGGTLLIRNDADGKSYLYDLVDIKKEKRISPASFSAQGRSEVKRPKPSQAQYMQNSWESQAENIEKNQQREPRLSDRDVLSLAADMALRQQNKSWTPEDRNRLEIFTVRLRRLEEAQAELKTLKQERKDLLDGRKASEVTKDERIELTQNKNRTDLAKKNVEKREAQLYEIESIEAVKTLLRKSREVVEKETAFKARQRYREKTEDRQRYQVLKKRLERTTNEWKRMLLKPTKDRYAPEELVRSCLEVALMLDESGRRLAGFGRNTENEILLPRTTRLVPYRMEQTGPQSIRIYVREETISETGETADPTLSSVRGVREGTQGGKDLQQVPGGDPGKVQSEVGRSAGRDGDRGGVPRLREGEGSGALDSSGVAENYGRTGTRGGEGEGVKNQQREPRLSDRDVLRRAADLALSDRKMNFTQADRERLKIFKKRLDILDEKQTQRQGYLQAKRDILSNSARLF